MLRRTLSLAMISLGMLFSLAGLGAIVVPSAAQAQMVPQPTARPAIDDGGDNPGNPGVPMGHVTGTVIDGTTGAPVPYAKVMVNGQEVIADANGNYDLWVPTGVATVALPPSEGMPVPESYTVEVTAGNSTVQHLTTPAAAPVPTPEPQVKAAPLPAEAPVVQVRAPASDTITAPERLPVTASDDNDMFGAWFWVSIGMAFLAGGLMIGYRADSMRVPALALARYAQRSSAQPHAAADAAALLAALLTTEIRGATHGDPLLAALLASDANKRRAAQDVLADLLNRPLHETISM